MSFINFLKLLFKFIKFKKRLKKCQKYTKNFYIIYKEISYKKQLF